MIFEGHQRRNRALVIGANGYLGRHIAKVLSKKEFPYHLAGRQPTSLDGYKNYTQIDLLKPSSFDYLLPEYDFIFYFAGLSGTYSGFSNYKSFIEINEIGLLNLLDGLKRKNSHAKVVFPSSRLVYKGQKDKPLTEEDEKEFKTVYAMNKFACESYLKMYQSSFNIDYSVFRICVPYGNAVDRSISFGTLSHMLSRAEKGENIIVFGDGVQKRSFIHAEDLAEIIVNASFLKFTDNNIFNVGGVEVFSIRDVSKYIARAYNVKLEFQPWPSEQLVIETGDTIFDSSKLMKNFNYSYQHDFVGWLERDCLYDK